MEEELAFKDTQELNFLISRINSAYQVYRDLLNPTVTWDTQRAKDSAINPEYVPQQSVFLKDPTIQKQFRDEIIEKISEVPSPHPLHLQCDLLLEEFLSLKLKSNPELIRSTLSKFYYVQVQYLQQFKYKFILNWANNCQYTSINTNLVKEKLREIDNEVLDCVEAYERLRNNDDVPLVPSKQEPGRTEICILPKDADYYIRTGAKNLSNSRSLYCLSCKIKWAWVANRTDIWKKSVCFLAGLKNKSIERMKLLTGQEDIGEQKVIVSLVTNINLKNLKKQQEIQRRAKAHHSTFAEEHKNLNEQLLNSSNDQIDQPPLIITNLKQLNGLLDTICKEFKLLGDVESDDGHSLSYQINDLLPKLFEIQRKRQEWKPYEPPEKDLVTLRMGYIQSLKRGGTIKRYSTEILPHQMTGYKFFKPLSIKEPDWLNLKQLNPQIPQWQKRQQLRLNEFGKIDSLLKASFDLLDVQDLPTINRVIEEFSMNYCERASKRGVLRTELGLSDDDIKKRYFSTLLIDTNSSVNPIGEEQIDLPLIAIKGLYTLKLLKSRSMKQKLFEIFNFFRSVERKLCLDLNDIQKSYKVKPTTQSSNPLLESLDGEITQYMPDKMPEIYGRQDLIEYLEGSIYVVDEIGEYIMYSLAEKDVRKILDELLLLGSYYIDKYEVWSEEQGENFPVIDRDFLTNEMLEEEVRFQEVKTKLISDYLEIYKHSIETDQQLKLAQKMSDLIALRPRLYLHGSYFTQGYWAHSEALEQHSMFLKSILSEYCQYDIHEIKPHLYLISEIWEKVENTINEISVIHETENPIALSTLEQASWENSYEIWRTSTSYSSPFRNDLIIDNPSQSLHLMNLVKEELKEKPLLPLLLPSMFETKVRGPIPKDIPSDLQLLCNVIEAFRFRSLLEQHFEENIIFEGIYRKQCLNMKRESFEMEFINFYGGNPHMSNLRDWPGSKASFKLPAYELTPLLTEHLDFKSQTCYKNLILSTGLEELRAVTEYHITHKHLLIIATQLNQYACDKWERQIAEIEIAKSMNYVTKKTKVHWPNVLGRKGEGLIEEKAENEVKSIKARIYSQVSENFVDPRKFKLAHREEMRSNFNRIMKKYIGVLGEKSPYQEVISRNLISLLVNGYCREILRDIYTQSIKIHIIKVSQELKRLLRIIPPEVYNEHFVSSNIFDSEGKLVNIKIALNTETILNFPNIKSHEPWKNWDPYFYAETPDVISKKIKSLAFRPRTNINGVSNITIEHEWPFTSQSKSILEVLRAVVHIIQIKLLIKFLSMNNIHVMDLQEIVLEGKNYWRKKEIMETDEMNLKAVDGLISESSPIDGFYMKIKETLDELTVLNDQILELPIENQVPYIIETAKLNYQKFAIVVFESFTKSLEDQRPIDSSELLSLLTPAFRYNRKSLYVKKNAAKQAEGCLLVTLCEEKLFIDNSPREHISSAYIPEIDTAFLPNSLHIRKYAGDFHRQLEKRLLEHVHIKQVKEQIGALDTIKGYLENVLHALRLKGAYFLLKTSEEVVACPKLYSKIVKNYNNTIGLKSSIAAKVIREDEYLAKSISEAKILKETFLMHLCKYTVGFIQNECGYVLDTSRLQNNISIHNEFTCNADRNYNDITRKIGSLHYYMNILRNRCTLVEAPTCGKAHVYLVKDMTKLTKKFADNIVKFKETEFRAREESFLLQKSYYDRLGRQKDEEIKELNGTLKNLQSNLDNIVNSQLSQKGNSLIYELDRYHRRLQEIKANMKLMPKQIRDIVYLDYKEEIETNNRKIQDLKKNFHHFKAQLTQELKADISFHKTQVFTEIQGKTSKSKAKQINNLLNEDISFTKKKQKLDLDNLQSQITKIRFMKIWAKHYRKHKFQVNIKDLQKQLEMNQQFWEQLNESQRREALLKQELSYTQQSLASAEKLADKLQTSIEDMNNQRLRLQQYKSNKGKRLNELEARVKQQEKIEHKDNQILLTQFYIQKERMQSLQISEEKAGQEYIPHHKRYQRELKFLKKTLEREQNMKLSAFEELNKFRNEMKNFNKDPESRVRDLRSEYQKLATELKSIKDQNTVFKQRLNDIGDDDFLSKFSGKKQTDFLNTVSSKASGAEKSLDL
ncbi:hypothetical protein SteCoe_27013 [Stentor coeruleus]|uniref:DUF4549 domain-containing protein n=1 Tax=Stentor coeruleus TaxID=5963 RepID=A0A1R2BBJ8_9CILI|nr:hypothetical protein SteCoe_27013 [Stentor coeruleus]